MRSFVLAAALATAPVMAWAEDVTDAVIGYMDFATETAGIIRAEQIDEQVFNAATFIDVRSADEYAQGHIPGATHIEWREVPARLSEIPDSGMVLFYCNTGMRSAQATFAARLLGHDNVLVIQGGLQEWDKSAGYKP